MSGLVFRVFMVLCVCFCITLACKPSVRTHEPHNVDAGTHSIATFCSGALHCKKGEACHKGRCGRCFKPKECGRMEGCLDSGVCGRCTSDAQCEEGKRCREGFCTPEKIRVLSLQVSASKWTALQKEENRESKLQAPCSLIYKGTTYKNCTIRPRGASSLAFPKLSWRIEFPEDAKHPGYARKINLRAEYNDRSYIRSVLAYEVFRALTSIPAPRTRFVRLRVNGKDQGLYVEIERIGGKFLERHKRDRTASMYESDPRGPANTGVGAFLPLPQKELYARGYDKKSGSESFDDLIYLIEEVIFQAYETKTLTLLRKHIHVQRYVDYLAVMTLIQNRDHFWKNYYFSKQKSETGKALWEFYPWDLDLSFGCIYTSKYKTLCETMTSETPILFGTRDKGISASYPTKGFYNLLTDVVLKDPEMFALYRQRLCSWTHGTFWTQTIFQLIRAYQSLLLSEVETDAQDRVKDTVDFLRSVQNVRTFISERAVFLRKELSCSED